MMGHGYGRDDLAEKVKPPWSTTWKTASSLRKAGKRLKKGFPGAKKGDESPRSEFRG
jgi:hypothetical protein